MAIDTAGRTVMFAAITVVIALLGLLLLGLSFMQGVALGAATAVLATMFAALTIIPALIGGSGNFIDGVLHEFDERGGFRFWGTKRRLTLPGHDWRSRRAVRRERKRAEGAGWERWSHVVQRRPWLAVVVALAVLLGLALPATKPAPGLERRGRRPARHDDAQGLRPDRRGLRRRHQRLVPARRRARPEGRQGGGAADRRRGARRQGLHLRRAARRLARRPGGHDHAPTRGPGRRRRRRPTRSSGCATTSCPRSRAKTDARVEVGGFTASNEDFSRVVADKLPLFVGVVVLFSALLLLVVFRSVIIPIKAAILNLLSIGAALGFVTLIFQEGHGAGLLGIGTGPIESFVPVLMFAIVFGLSMDYEVFLISRVHEEWERTGDASALGRARPADHRPGDHRGRLDHDPRVRARSPSATTASSSCSGSGWPAPSSSTR